MIDGSLLPLFFHDDVPVLGNRGDYFGESYFGPSYFESQYFVRLKEIRPYADIVNFSLDLNRDLRFTLEIQTQLEHVLSINRQVEELLEINRQLDFTVER